MACPSGGPGAGSAHDPAPCRRQPDGQLGPHREERCDALRLITATVEKAVAAALTGQIDREQDMCDAISAVAPGEPAHALLMWPERRSASLTGREGQPEPDKSHPLSRSGAAGPRSLWTTAGLSAAQHAGQVRPCADRLILPPVHPDFADPSTTWELCCLQESAVPPAVCSGGGHGARSSGGQPAG